MVSRSFRSIIVVCLIGCGSASAASAALLSLTVVAGVRGTDGSTILVDPIHQETLSSSTQGQIFEPPLYDLAGISPLGLTVRITNVSDAELLFPDVLPGVSVLTGVYGVPDYSGKTNVASGGSAGRDAGPGSDGAVSRTALDLTTSLDVMAGAAQGSNGGGGAAATGVADNWIAVIGASGGDLVPFLAGRRLAPGEYVDVPDFVRIMALHRALEDVRLGIGFDLPTFSFGGFTLTTSAWTGAFVGPAVDVPPADPTAAAEPGTLGLAGLGAAILAAGRCRRRARADRRQ